MPTVKAAVEPRWKEPEPERVRVRVPPPQPEADEPVPAKWLSTAKILAICSAVAMLVAVGYLVNLGVLGNRTKPVVPASGQVEQAPVAPTPEPPPAAPPNTNTASRTQNGHRTAHRTTPPPLPPKPRKVPPATQDAAALNPQTPPKQITKPRGCSIEIDEIPSYLSLADSYRNRGKYDRAILEYNAILSCQPYNRQAQDGLRNAQDAERLSQ